MAISSRDIRRLTVLVDEKIPLSSRANQLLTLLIEMLVYELRGGEDVSAEDLAKIARDPEFIESLIEFVKRDTKRLDYQSKDGIPAVPVFHFFSNRKALAQILERSGPSIQNRTSLILDKD